MTKPLTDEEFEQIKKKAKMPQAFKNVSWHENAVTIGSLIATIDKGSCELTKLKGVGLCREVALASLRDEIEILKGELKKASLNSCVKEGGQ